MFRSILNQFVNYYFEPNPDNNKLYEVKREKIAHFYAEAILRPAVKVCFFFIFKTPLVRINIAKRTHFSRCVTRSLLIFLRRQYQKISIMNSHKATFK